MAKHYPDCAYADLHFCLVCGFDLEAPLETLIYSCICPVCKSHIGVEYFIDGRDVLRIRDVWLRLEATPEEIALYEQNKKNIPPELLLGESERDQES